MRAALFVAAIAAWMIAWGTLLALLSMRASRNAVGTPLTLLDQPGADMRSSNRPVRRDRRRHVVAIVCLALAFSTCADAADRAPPPRPAFHAERAWMRATPPAAPVAGGFVTLRNDSAVDDRLLSITSPDAQRVEIHEMRMDGGMMRMRQLADGLPVPAGATVRLAPGGYHLMFIAPVRALRAGDRVRARFDYAHAPAQDVTFAVQPLTATEAPPSNGRGDVPDRSATPRR